MRWQRPALLRTETALSIRIALIGCALVPLHRFLCVCTYAAAGIITVACARGTARARQKEKELNTVVRS